MRWRNWLVALIGFLFIISPWVMHYSNHVGAAFTSVILGVIQMIAAIQAAYMEDSSGFRIWQTWVALIMGVCFIIEPFAFSLGTSQTWLSIIMGVVTVALNVWTMAGKDDSSNMNSGNNHRAHA